MVRRSIWSAARAAAVNAYRAVAAIGIASTTLWVSGCYTYSAQTAAGISTNALVSADITDAGRVALGERVGPEVQRLEGKVVQRTDTSFRVLVSKVTYLSGSTDQWQGQEVSLRTQDVKSLTQRSYSKSRTALLIGAMAAALIVTVLGLNFLGITSGDPTGDKGGNPPPAS